MMSVSNGVTLSGKESETYETGGVPLLGPAAEADRRATGYGSNAGRRAERRSLL